MNRSRILAAAAFSSALTLACSCGDGFFSSSGSDPSEPGPDEEVVDGHFVMRGTAALRACTVCPNRTPDPRLRYMTPTALRTGHMKTELLRGENDPTPYVLVDDVTPRDCDLVRGATFANVATSSIPPGTYTHVRTTLAYSAFEVPATGHAGSFGTFPGTLRVSYALSDHQDPTLGSRRPGDYVAELVVNGSVPPGGRTAGYQPVVFPPPYPDAVVDTTAGLYRVTYAIPGGPLQLGPGLPQTVQIDVTYYIEDGFGWEDKNAPGYTNGVLDLTANPLETETPAYLGINGYSVTLR